MINDIPKWCSLLTYDGLKYHVNVTEGLENFAEDRIRVGKEEAGTSNFNQAYDKLQANQEKVTTVHPRMRGKNLVTKYGLLEGSCVNPKKSA